MMENKLVSFDVMKHKLNIGRQLGEPHLSQMVNEVITDLTAHKEHHESPEPYKEKGIIMGGGEAGLSSSKLAENC
jgi:hypothetical protein